ncbi:MAG TPA: methylmalonyl-CoA decarboxylase [Victivallales bacterium]|nr:methylmalonyl-CoA decarboxylase [Victivallales bacterium]
MNKVILESKNQVGTIILNDPRHLNALSAELVDDIIAGLEEFRNKNVRTIIIRAQKNVKIWSAGHDVRELPTGTLDPLTYADPLRKVCRELHDYPKPVIALIEGSVWGGACELIMSCDMIYASEESTFAITPAKLGVPYNIQGILNFMNSIPMHLLKEMLFTAQPISAEKAEVSGMISGVIKMEDLEEHVNKIAGFIVNNSPLSISVMKEGLKVLSEAFPMNPEAFEKIQAGRRVVYNSDDYKEGIRSFFEKRKPVFKGN